MIGYVYITYCPNGRVYIGQRRKSKFDKSYIGSGKILKDMMKKYDKYNDFKCEILHECNTLEELDEKEIYEIKRHREIYGDKCINILRGGQIHTEVGMFLATTIEYYETHPVNRDDFKKYCTRTKINFDDFDEFHVANRIKNRTRLYVYKRKKEDVPIRVGREKDVKYWETHYTNKKVFKKYCKRNGYKFEYFELVYVKNHPTETKRRLYYFFLKDTVTA